MALSVSTTDTAALRRLRRATDYLAAAQIYLLDNVLLREPLRAEHLKPRLLGHWGTCPGINYIYAGLHRLVRDTGSETLVVTGPGHGAPAVHANLWLDGSHADRDPALSRDLSGLAELVRRFSWPGGFAGNPTPHLPGVIYEGGEVGYALPVAVGAALDAPDRIVAAIVGDGEAETGATAAAWQSTKFLDPVTSGAVLPILHMNHYKIGSPSIFATLDDEELHAYFKGSGWSPLTVDTSSAGDPDADLAIALDEAYDRIRGLQEASGAGDRPPRPRWPLLVVRSPKGWGTIAQEGGTPVAGTAHSHLVPAAGAHEDDEHLAALEGWLRSYRPEELFDDDGRPHEDILDIIPDGEARLGCTPAGNGGRLRRPLPLPALEPCAPDVAAPGATQASPTATLARWLADVLHATEDRRDFRIMCPDEIESNNLDAVLDASPRAYVWPVDVHAEHLGPDGRVMEVLSEHLCQAWLQGYVLTGRHGLFPTYEAFAAVVDSMVNQYAKWLTMLRDVPWREPVSSFTYLLTSQGWHQESNGYTHQAPGFVNHLLQEAPSVVRVFFPPDATTLLATMHRCLDGTDEINVVTAGKLSSHVWLDIADARRHCEAGAGIWDWASTDGGGDPDVVLAAAGGVPTTEVLAAAKLLRHDVPQLRVRVVNVVDLLTLAPPGTRPTALSDEDFGACFGHDTDVVFAFHGYPSAVHQLLHGRLSPNRFHVRGYMEEGATTTPHDLLLANGLSRHHLAIDALRHARARPQTTDELIARYEDDIEQTRQAIRRDGIDPPHIREWRWA